MSNTNSIVLNDAQQAATDQCLQRIRDAIKSQKGNIGFDEYMQLALHDAAVGYYHSEVQIFGEQGDFTTAPEISVHLAYCLAHACAKLIYDDTKRNILEIGAGSGKLAADIIQYLHSWGQLPHRFYIHEPSAALRDKQKALLQREVPEHFAIFEWLPDLSCELETVIIIANEVLDALPVKCFEIHEREIKERFVSLDHEEKLCWQLQNPSAALDPALDYLTIMLDEPLLDYYQSEINVSLDTSLSAWAGSCEQCVMILIDYGYPRSEYYHPQRNMGTLRCYFKHQLSEDPFTYPGLQDITADVDFSAVAKFASYLQLGVLAFSSQRNFMLANNLLDWRPTGDEMKHVAQIAQLKQLTLGGAMSERFQVMVLGKGIDYGADRFTLRDMRARL